MKCAICDKEFKVLTWKHLFFKHNITIEQYDGLYGVQKHSVNNPTPDSLKQAQETRIKNGTNVPWNKGLTKENNASMMKISEDRRGINNPFFRIKDKEAWKRNVAEGRKEFDNWRRGKTYEEIFGAEKAQNIKEKLSIASIGKPGRHTTPHSQETKDKLRAATARQIANSKDFVSQLQKDFFVSLTNRFPQYSFEFQKIFGFYVIDITMPDFKIAIEVDGDFWHVNEQKGFTLKYDSQRRNKNNEKCKNSFILNRGWHLIRFWESDIKEHVDLCCLRLETFIADVKGK